jgi:hypothetical protein
MAKKKPRNWRSKRDKTDWQAWRINQWQKRKKLELKFGSSGLFGTSVKIQTKTMKEIIVITAVVMLGIVAILSVVFALRGDK